MKAARDEWHGLLAGLRLDQLVFLDEFGATTDMTRTRGRGPVGERVVCKTPHGHWKVLSTIAAMTVRGMLCGGGTFGGATDTDTFVAFVREGLVPLLRPGQVVVMDNLPAHRTSKVDDLLESAGCYALRLPPYSPDFNPIEMAISKVKALLRKLEQRTVPTLQAAIGEALSSVTPDDAMAYVQHCGYGDTRG